MSAWRRYLLAAGLVLGAACAGGEARTAWVLGRGGGRTSLLGRCRPLARVECAAAYEVCSPVSGQRVLVVAARGAPPAGAWVWVVGDAQATTAGRAFLSEQFRLGGFKEHAR